MDYLQYMLWNNVEQMQIPKSVIMVEHIIHYTMKWDCIVQNPT